MTTLLRQGDTGIAVRQLQRLLNDAGARPVLTQDGHYGPATRAAVVAAQRRLGLVVDGITGPKTLEALQRGIKPTVLLGEGDLARAADRLGVPLAVVKAVNEVESRGLGFLPDGRPVILFERHVMYRRVSAALGKDHADHLAGHVAPAIINPSRGGYLGGAAEHGRLNQARQIHEASAIESASWGSFQIMGWHWQRLGYDSAAVFERLMCRSEADHLEAFIRFIESDPALHRALKARKWAAFAAGYNGPAYKENLYDIKLARAFERYRDMEQAA